MKFTYKSLVSMSLTLLVATSASGMNYLPTLEGTKAVVSTVAGKVIDNKYKSLAALTALTGLTYYIFKGPKVTIEQLEQTISKDKAALQTIRANKATYKNETFFNNLVSVKETRIKANEVKLVAMKLSWKDSMLNKGIALKNGASTGYGYARNGVVACYNGGSTVVKGAWNHKGKIITAASAMVTLATLYKLGYINAQTFTNMCNKVKGAFGTGKDYVVASGKNLGTYILSELGLNKSVKAENVPTQETIENGLKSISTIAQSVVPEAKDVKEVVNKVVETSKVLVPFSTDLTVQK